MHYWAVIAAAGLGARMVSAVPKQYLMMNDETLLERSIALLAHCSEISNTVVVLHPQDAHWSHLPAGVQNSVLTATGGALRAESVLNGLAVLADLADAQDWVLVHDAARPYCQPAEILRLMTELQHHPVGGLLGMPVRDTLKRVDADGVVTATVSRDHLWHAQTPQMFRYGLLRDALQQALAAGQEITDEASAVELFGLQPHMVLGSMDNQKVTYPEDLGR